MPDHVTITARRFDASRFARHTLHESHGIFADQPGHWPLIIICRTLITGFAPNA
jgi:hypothetical protein